MRLVHRSTLAIGLCTVHNVLGHIQDPRCSNFAAPLSANHSIVTLAQTVQEGSNFTGHSTETSYNTLQTDLPQLCRFAFTISTSSNSTADAEIWLPTVDSWNGRFLAVGNGGFAGGINYPDIVWGVRKGFATMSTNTGHDSTQSDGNWMLNQPEKMIDFGHRALHLTTEAAKDLVRAYYQQDLHHSYYAGCSTGGRQGLNAAQRCPKDYDGVLVGSAIPSQTHTSAWQIYVALQQYPNTSAEYIPATMWATIHQAVLDQCDLNDGVEDRIIMNPGECDFDSSVLLCSQSSSNNSSCLNEAQNANLERMYAPWLDGNGTLVNPGISTSGEASFSYLMNGAEPQFGPSFYLNAVFNDSAWDWRNMSPDVVAFAAGINPGGMDVNPDMDEFRQAGGKLIQYHG